MLLLSYFLKELNIRAAPVFSTLLINISLRSFLTRKTLGSDLYQMSYL